MTFQPGPDKSAPLWYGASRRRDAEGPAASADNEARQGDGKNQEISVRVRLFGRLASFADDGADDEKVWQEASAEIPQGVAFFHERVRQVNHETYLCGFHRLHGQWAEPNPSPCAADFRPDARNENSDEQANNNREEDIHKTPVQVVIH